MSPQFNKIRVVCYADDWVADGYRWHNVGCDRLPRRQPTLYKRKFHTMQKDGPSPVFKRSAFTNCTAAVSPYVLVHYSGDATAAETFPHCGSKATTDAKPFQRTAPSVLTRIATQSKEHQPSVVHKSAFASASDVTTLHRDNKQVRNVRERVTALNRISRDGLANLHDLAYDVPDFVHLIQTYPDLIVVAGRYDMLQHLNSLLLTGNRTHTQLLSYDTTFNFGEFYISVLLFRAVCFHEKPVMPALFMLHERKLRNTHQKLVEILADKVPAMNDSNCVLVTDGEEAFNVFEERLPR